MIRILFDELGDSHSDLFIKIDSTPAFIIIADSYYIGCILHKSYNSKYEEVLGFINHFKNVIEEIDTSQVFIPVDLSDQYVGGFLLSKGKKESIKLAYITTTQFAGYEYKNVSLNRLITEGELNYNVERDWIISLTSIKNGLNWSSDRIIKLSIK